MLLFDGGAERMEPAIRVIIIRTSAVMAFVFFVGISFRPVNSFDVLSEGTGILGTENRIRDWEWGVRSDSSSSTVYRFVHPGILQAYGLSVE
jgi:hypothetical protein